MLATRVVMTLFSQVPEVSSVGARSDQGGWSQGMQINSSQPVMISLLLFSSELLPELYAMCGPAAPTRLLGSPDFTLL